MISMDPFYLYYFTQFRAEVRRELHIANIRIWPTVLLLSGEWTRIFGAAMSTIGFLGLSLLAFETLWYFWAIGMATIVCGGIYELLGIRVALNQKSKDDNYKFTERKFNLAGMYAAFLTSLTLVAAFFSLFLFMD